MLVGVWGGGEGGTAVLHLFPSAAWVPGRVFGVHRLSPVPPRPAGDTLARWQRGGEEVGFFLSRGLTAGRDDAALFQGHLPWPVYPAGNDRPWLIWQVR